MSHQPSYSNEELRDAFIHCIMGVHGFTKQGEDEETQRCIDESIAWFDKVIAAKDAETKKAGEEAKKELLDILNSDSSERFSDRVYKWLRVKIDKSTEETSTPPEDLKESKT